MEEMRVLAILNALILVANMFTVGIGVKLYTEFAKERFKRER